MPTNPKLSIIIANRNDIVMMNVTLNSIYESIKSLNFETETIICDNSDQKFYELMPIALPVGFQKKANMKMIRQENPSFTAARMAAAHAARGKYLFCIDSHVMMGSRTLQDSVDFMDRHSDNEMLGFGHPPIRWAHQGPAAVKHTLRIADNGTPWGPWDTAFTTESKMFWKFMPWICDREWYLNTLQGYGSHSDNSVSWGGAELLQQIKSWMLGYEQWAIPTDPVIHIGPYTPAVIKTGQYKYRTYSANGNFPHGFGVLLAFYVLGDGDGYRHAKLCEDRILARHKIGVDAYWERVKAVGKKERDWLDKNKKYGYMELLTKKPWLSETNN